MWQNNSEIRGYKRNREGNIGGIETGRGNSENDVKYNTHIWISIPFFNLKKTEAITCHI